MTVQIDAGIINTINNNIQNSIYLMKSEQHISYETVFHISK